MVADVLIDGFAGLSPAGGIGRYVRDLSHALQHCAGAPPARFAIPRDLRAIGRERYAAQFRHELPLPWSALGLAAIVGARFGLRQDALFGHPAVFHSTLGWGPLFAQCRLIEHVHDLTFLDHPEWHPLKTRSFFRATVPAAVANASVVLTHSLHVRASVKDRFSVGEERLETIPPPLGHGFRPIPRAEARARLARRFGLEGEYVLHVGTIEPRKNHVGLVEAFERMRRAGFPGPLLLVGHAGWLCGPILARIEASPDRAAVIRLENLDDDDMVALYGACTACAFPSLEEGFGMPLLESMACGAACVTSDHPALAELGAGIEVGVPARDPDALADALLRLWRDPDERAARGAQGPPRASGYTFERWAGRIFALYRRELAAAGVDTPRTGG